MTGTAKIGRPPKVTRQDIVDAALRIGLEKANVRTVADELGMSLPGLHYYVRSRDDLFDLVFEAIFGKLAELVDAADGDLRGLLTQFARSMFDVFSLHPEAIATVYTGRSVASSNIPAVIERVIARGVAVGLSASQAFEIFRRLCAATIGAAVLEASDRAVAAAGNNSWTIYQPYLPEPGAEWHLQSLAQTNAPQDDRIDHFHTVLVTLDGLLAEVGL